MRTTYHVYYINKYGEKHPTCGKREESTEATKKMLAEWAAKWGHTILFDTYREIEIEPNPEFVDACLRDIKGDWE